jgi:flagellar biosynthesis protein FlhG
MTEIVLDQAAGLRKLLGHGAQRTIAIGSAARGAGRTLIAANLAVALARAGHSVMLLDCSSGPGSSTALLGARASADVLDGLRGEAKVCDLAGEGAAGVRVARAGALVTALRTTSDAHAMRLPHLFDELRDGADLLLVDSPPASIALCAAARELVLVVPAQAHAITDSYRFVKRFSAECGRRPLRVLINRVQLTSHADRIFGNLSATCRKFLNLPLELVGQIPHDERLVRAARLRWPAADACPESPGARALQDCADRISRWASSGEEGFGEFANRLVSAVRAVDQQIHVR